MVKRTKNPVATGQIIMLVVVIALTVAAWLYTALTHGDPSMGAMHSMHGDSPMDEMHSLHSDSSMDSMAVEGGGYESAGGSALQKWLLSFAATPVLPTFALFVPMWIAMSVGMMLPTAIPMIICMNKVCERRKVEGQAYVPGWLFVSGYLILWIVFGIVCWVVASVVFYFIGSWLSDGAHLWLVVGAIFVFGGIYQLSPLKSACLRGCQHPVSFIMRNWREGKAGSLVMGMQHGATCVGCCAALMIVMLALGMMNLIWMGIFTVIMFAEKNAKFGTVLSKVVGGLLLAAGALVLAIGTVNLVALSFGSL